MDKQKIGNDMEKNRKRIGMEKQNAGLDRQ